MKEESSHVRNNVGKAGLSKSRLLAFRQCPKRLWLETNRRDLLEYSPDTERRFQIGHQVGAIARELHPGGTLIQHQDNLGAALAETQRSVQTGRRTPLFEATLQHEGLLVRTDILLFEEQGLHLLEVKSSTSVKPYHLEDAAIQAWVLQSLGLDTRRVSIAVVDNSFVYPGERDYNGLLRNEEVTLEIAPLVQEVRHWVTEAKAILAAEVPDVEMGKQCFDPYECPFTTYCAGKQPEFPATLLPGKAGKILAAELDREGYRDLREVPAGRITNGEALRIWRVTAEGKAELKEDAARTLSALPYPRHYLDFESAQFAVPIFAGTRPYEQLPFQWSLHTEVSRGELKHQDFLDLTGAAPMRPATERLIEALEMPGPIFVYSSFERTRLNALGERFPDLAAPVRHIVDRLVDLLPITKRSYYHPDMRGSWSLKAVLPTIAPDLAYEALGDIRDGTAAQIAYETAIDSTTDEALRIKIGRELRSYCCNDTLGLVRLTEFLEDRD